MVLGISYCLIGWHIWLSLIVMLNLIGVLMLSAQSIHHDVLHQWAACQHSSLSYVIKKTCQT